MNLKAKSTLCFQSVNPSEQITCIFWIPSAPVQQMHFHKNMYTQLEKELHKMHIHNGGINEIIAMQKALK